MALPIGLVPALVFALTVGVSVSVTAGAYVIHRTGGGAFAQALRTAAVGAGGLYLVGTVAVWAIAGGIGLWEVPVALLAAGAFASIMSLTLPLTAGQRIVRRVRGVDGDTALRFSTYGWPVAMSVVFGVFVAPGGLVRGDALSLGGRQICLAGFCGISAPLAATAALEAAVAVLGPGVVGVVLHSSAARKAVTG